MVRALYNILAMHALECITVLATVLKLLDSE